MIATSTPALSHGAHCKGYRRGLRAGAHRDKWTPYSRINPGPPVGYPATQYSTGSGSRLRQRYQVATERHGRQRSP